MRRVTGWAGSSVYSGTTVYGTSGGSGTGGSWCRRRGPIAMEGGVPSKSVPPLPRVPRPGVARPGSAREGSAQAGTPSNLRGQRSANREGIAANSGVPVLALSGPAIHERTGSPAPREKPAERRWRVREGPGSWGTCRTAERAERVWRVRGRAPGCGGAPAPSPENAATARGAGREAMR